MKSIIDNLMQIDLFGEKAEFQVKGKASYPSI